MKGPFNEVACILTSSQKALVTVAKGAEWKGPDESVTRRPGPRHH